MEGGEGGRSRAFGPHPSAVMPRGAAAAQPVDVNEPEPESHLPGSGAGSGSFTGQKVYLTVGYAANPEALALVAYT